ncbi:hypothetical protein GCM10009552_38840 [Rothia nasimurium]
MRICPRSDLDGPVARKARSYMGALWFLCGGRHPTVAREARSYRGVLWFLCGGRRPAVAREARSYMGCGAL